MSRLFGLSSFLFNDSDGIFTELLAYSVALWVNRAALTTEQECFSEGNRGTSAPIILLRTGPTSGKAAIAVRNDAGVLGISTVSTAATVFDGTWHHLGYAQDAAGNWQAYVDGIADSAAHGSYAPGATTINCAAIGAFRNTTTAGSFNTGSCSHVATWQRQLSAREMLALANGCSPALLGPVHYWPCWGIDATEPDVGVGHRGMGDANGSTAGPTNPRVSPHLLHI